jgi:hypothetical protein
VQTYIAVLKTFRGFAVKVDLTNAGGRIARVTELRGALPQLRLPIIIPA